MSSWSTLTCASLALGCALAVGCAGPAQTSLRLEAEVGGGEELRLAWGRAAAVLSAEEATPITLARCGDAELVTWGEGAGALWLRGEADAVVVERVVGQHSWPDPADWPREPVGSGRFRGGLTLRLHPGGRVSILSSGSKLDALPRPLLPRRGG